MSRPLSRDEHEALAYLYSGGDETIECHSAQWVVTRYPQKCLSVLHKGRMTFPAGTKMIVERAKVDGEFGSCYTCHGCITEAQKELSQR